MLDATNGNLNKSNSEIKEIEEMAEMGDVQFNEANLLFHFLW